MTWAVRLTRRAKKDLASLEKKQRLLIEGWILENLEGCENPKAVPGASHVTDTKDGWRYRVGSYRIVCRVLEDEIIIEVIRICHRQGVYANLPKP